ncbi:hypothetical protein N476_26290 [Pseudoalteromonas luteoviolacea H33]|uniref:Uncharacterized protein n=1 Tax=Pseudoalteromonas luteoviolacea H33 TaxID=1365251 RepID=A0A167GNK6_9GAMM|nr:hypothetical protein N476_26290 [Pseudoalteromonas luteoviolacea H33]KZN73006.1 hypothetical protein N477_24105 [Pseudoalteromonas luteoviolacea H33-S]
MIGRFCIVKGYANHMGQAQIFAEIKLLSHCVNMQF